MNSSFIFLLFLALQQVIIMKGFESSDHGQTSTQLVFKLGTPCTYSYQVAVHTARGSKSTASQGYEVYTLVDVIPVHREDSDESLHTIQLKVYQPRIRRLQGGRVPVNHPVNEDLERKLSKPFYFRQYDHGTVVDAFMPKTDDYQAIALKKGIAGAFQVNLKTLRYKTIPPVKEHDDSGIYFAKYKIIRSNDTHTTIKREWTSNDYIEFADGTPTHGEHNIKFRHSGIVHVRANQIYEVQRHHTGTLQSQKGNARANNKKEYQEQEQDIQISTSGYNKLTLIKCNNDVPGKEAHHRSKRSAQTPDNLEKDMQGLHQENLVFKDSDKINFKEVGGDKIKFRPFYELMRCFTDPTVKNREIGECAREMHKLVEHDEESFKKICHLVLQRNHQNVTSWSVLISAVAGHGKHQAQSVLAQALMSEYPRQLTLEEYETLLEGIFHIPKGPIHKDLFDALFTQATRDSNHGHKSPMAMLVLAGLTKRSETAGYNSTLSDVVAELIHNSYHNKSNMYDPDSVEHESYVRDHVWAFGNLGHSSGLEVILQHANHDSSGIRSAVVASMRKLPAERTHQLLLDTLYKDERNDVKAAVIDVFIERHVDLTDKTVQALEHAMWHAEDGDALDAAVQTFLENHHNHPKRKHITNTQKVIRRRKRSLLPFLKSREYKLGPNKRWVKNYGGQWLGAETVIQFKNQIKLRLGIFGGKYEVDVDNNAHFNAHIFSPNFDIINGKASFKAAATFKNDIPKDLIHLVADAGDNILKMVDGISNIIVEQVQKFINKLRNHVPLNFQKLSNFLNSIAKFVENFTTPLKPINLINKIITFGKSIFDQIEKWKWMIRKANGIETAFNKLNTVDDIFKKVTETLVKILDIDKRISLALPHNLHPKFRIEDLLGWLRSVPLGLQDKKIKEFFKTMKISEPDGFNLQLPFKYAIQFSSSMDKFTTICTRLVTLADNVLDMASIFDTLHNIQLPQLILPRLEGKFSVQKRKGFNFGLAFDWKRILTFKVNLKGTEFMKFVNSLGKLSQFFHQFQQHSFDLQRFFESIMPGKNLDIAKLFEELYDQTNTNAAIRSSSSEVFRYFVNRVINLLDLTMPNVTVISDITYIFKELGPEMKSFAIKNAKTLCNVNGIALNSSNIFKYFANNIDGQGIAILKNVDVISQGALNEVLNYTAKIDELILEIEKNLTATTGDFASNSLTKLTESLKNIQSLADQVAQFANGTSSKSTGVCMNAADFSADIIDKVQNVSRDAISELTNFTGPAAQDIKNFGLNVNKAITNVEQWYNENMAVHVGKISKIARLIADFITILNTKKGFLDTVQNIAIKIKDVLTHIQDLPDYASKARKTVDDIIKFADGAGNLKVEILKLDIRKQFGISYDSKIRNFCERFKDMASQTLDIIGGYDIVAEVNNVFNLKTHALLHEAVNKFRGIKEPLKEISDDLKGITSMVTKITSVLTDLQPFNSNLSPILATIKKLPNCQKTLSLFTESFKPCVRKAMIVGKDILFQYQDMRKQVETLYHMIPDVWKSLKVQNCFKGGPCISKSFIHQATIIQQKIDVLKEKFEEATGYTDMLETCQTAVENTTEVFDTLQRLIKQVKDFDMRDDVNKVKEVLSSLVGRDVAKNKDGGIQRTERIKRSTHHPKDTVKRALNYIIAAKRAKIKIDSILRSTFKAMQTVYAENIMQHIEKVKIVRSRLQISQDVWTKIKNIFPILQGLNAIVKESSAYSEKLKVVTSVFSSHIVRLISGTSELGSVIKPHVSQHLNKVMATFNMVNGFISKVTEFLNTIQLRQRGLDLTQYKRWSAYPYCSEDVCVRSLRRSSSLYYSTIFPWKFPHLDDLSSMKDCGRWLIPGLFDDYKVEGIAQLSKSEIILGMHGVSVNNGKASILVITNPGSNNVRKIIQLGSPQSPFTEKIGGVSIARNSIWISSGTRNKIYRINKGSVTGSMSSAGPSWVGISNNYTVEGVATSVSFDEAKTMLWVTDSKNGKGYGYGLSSDGDLLSSHVSRVIVIGENAQAMTIIRQFGTEYVVVSRCAMRSGFQCKLEFHHLSNGDQISENTLSRVVRTPSGLESIQSVSTELLVIVFSSATYSEKDKIKLIGGDFEDRCFRMKLPILNTTLAVYENCLTLKVLDDWIIEPRQLFPLGDLQCGVRRKRSLQNQLLESDVYSEDLEKTHIRKKRETGETSSCLKKFQKTLKKGSLKFAELSHTFLVYGVSIRLFVGARGYYFIDLECQLCMKDKMLKVGLIPGAYINVYAGASISLYVVEAGVTIEGILLETRLIPEIAVKFDKWPLKACIELRMEMTPLKIRISLWYRLYLCVRIKCRILWCSVKIKWCKKQIFYEWSWSTAQIKRTLLSTCQRDADTSPPAAGTCKAKQVGDKAYLVQWHGFKEDTTINHYWIKVGPYKGSDYDYGANVGNSLSTVVRNLPIMHGREVYVSVIATNDEGLHSRLAECTVFQAKRKAPQFLYVYDGSVLGQDIDYQSDTYVLGVNFAWSKGNENVVDIKWGISAFSKCTLDENEVDVHGLTSVGETNSIQTSDLSLKHGQKYYTRVVAINSIGLRTVVCSDGVVIDTTPPTAGYLFDGFGKEDADFLSSTRRVRAKFQSFVDKESPLVKYEWKIMLYENAVDITPFVNIPITQRTPLIDR